MRGEEEALHGPALLRKRIGSKSMKESTQAAHPASALSAVIVTRTNELRANTNEERQNDKRETKEKKQRRQKDERRKNTQVITNRVIATRTNELQE